MALRLRRDVQKASYYVWFLGADEAKGLRGPRVINSVLPYLIDRSREQEPLKVTLQVSHKGIKILQGSSKHFIPHSAITSSVQSEDIVACVLLLYNPATKCPLHVHAYRCDSETTAEALHQQLQILINRPENQKRFEELESRLGIVPFSNAGGSHKSSLPFDQQQKHAQRRHEASPKRFSSSLGSDTGNSTRESECSEDRNGSPMSRSPPIIKQKGDLFDSLAAELRAKLNGNGPPLLLPPRDYDTVHRSKGNLAAIELRRCRNSLIVGASTPAATNANKQQMSSRGSSGIGSDLAPSPERQDVNSSSEDEHWSNEADNSVIALKPSQIQMERKQPLLNRKSVVQPPEDNYLRDLPSKPYNPSISSGSNGNAGSGNREKELRPMANRVSHSQPWNKEDEIKPIIMRPSDYDAKFNRVLMDKHHDDAPYKERSHNYTPPDDTGFCKYKEDPPTAAQKSSSYDVHDGGFHNHMDKMLKKKLSLERKQSYKVEEDNADYDSDADHHVPLQSAVSVPMAYRKENLTDKQKFQEYNGKKIKNYPEPDRFGRQRYVDPADLPFTQPKPVPHQYPSHSPEREIQRPVVAVERHRERDRQRPAEPRSNREREFFSHSNERNPYKEPGSIPYIESMEKMMKSQAMRYKSFENEPTGKMEYQPEIEKNHRVSPRKSVPRSDKSSTHVANEDLEVEKEFSYSRKSQSREPREYVNPNINANVTPKDRFKDAKEKFRAMERSRYITEDKETNAPSRTAQPSSRNIQRRSSIEHADSGIRYDDWSDEEECPVPNPRSTSREHWESSRDQNDLPREYHEMRGSRDIPDSHNDHREYHHQREMREHREPQQYRDRPMDKRSDGYGPGIPLPISNSKSLSNLTKGYRHSYAEPAFARSGGRVGLAAVNPY